MIKINRVFKSAIKYLQACVTEKIKEEREKQNMYFVFNNDNRKLNNSTLIDNKGSNIDMNLQNNLEEKVKELEKNKLLCCNINGCLIEDFTELLLDITEERPELIAIIKNKRRTQSIMSKLETLSHVSDKNFSYNKLFFEHFRKGHGNN